MSVINSQPLIGASGNQGVAEYNLTRSLRLRKSATAFLSRTPSTAGNRQKWTWSGWVKRGALDGAIQNVFNNNTTPIDGFSFEANNTLKYRSFDGASEVINMITTQVFRDVSAWYHIVIAMDTTQATSSNRFKLYVNGVQITSFSTATYPALNYNTGINSTTVHQIGAYASGGTLDGYITELNLVDGQELTPADFGETSATTGVWIPKRYAGTYGTNGFYLDFEDTSSTAALGYDAAGSNDWTVNNISLTSGATYDSMTDVPTLTSATAANYCVMNPLIAGGAATSNGNLTVTGTSGSSLIRNSTMGLTSGKFYAEMTAVTLSGSQTLGLAIYSASALGVENGSQSRGYFYTGQKYSNGSVASYGNSFTAGDVIGVAIDLDNSKIWFSKNGTWQASGDPTAGTNAAYTDVTSNTWFVTVQGGNDYSAAMNFGQRPFTYTPPTGFVALNTFNLPTPTIGATASSQANDYFDATTYTGNGSTQSITNSGGFQPDFVWIKNRTSALDHRLVDAVRGVTKEVYSNTTGTEGTDANGLTAFNSNGFSVGSSGSYNGNTNALVAWQWKANGAGSSNTAGTISSTVSANTTAGCSIVTYTGTGTTGATVGHGLGVAPNMIIIKSRGAVTSWPVYHSSLGATSWILLNSTSAATTSSQEFNNTAPTSTVFTIGSSSANSNQSATYVAYCFAEVAGYSKFGSYIGNGSADGTFVYTGFRPRFIMLKNVGGSANWIIQDTATNPSNNAANYLLPDSSSSEGTNSVFDILSNGFKIRNTFSAWNTNGNTYIFAAFAEAPFKYANAR
jgi:hypothetical protein